MHTKDTADRIRASALALFVEKGITAATTREIAEGAGITEAAIYRHFAGKDALVWALFYDHHLALAEALEAAQAPCKGLRAKAEAIVRCYCRKADQDWLTFRFHLLNQHSLLQKAPKGAPNPVDIVERVIGDGMKAGEIRERPVPLLAAMALGVVLQPAVHKIYGRMRGKLGSAADLLAGHVWVVLKG